MQPPKFLFLLHLCGEHQKETAMFPDSTLHDDKNIGTDSSPRDGRSTRKLYNEKKKAKQTLALSFFIGSEHKYKHINSLNVSCNAQ